MTDRPLVLVAGKGGVGKTTVAAALAARFAASGQRTLLVSTDPAHSVGDLLDTEVGSGPTDVSPLLWAIEIDAAQVADGYVERVRRDAHRAVTPEVRAALDRHLDLARHAPGTLESAVVDRLADLVADCPGRYDRVVVDTAPTGHTLRLLELPNLLQDWIRGLVRQRERAGRVDHLSRSLVGEDDPPDDPVLARLRVHQGRMTQLRDRLRQDAWVIPVLVPERLPIVETERAVAALVTAGLSVGPLVVNRVLPEAEVAGDYLGQRLTQQRVHLDDLARRLPDHAWVEVPQLPRDVTGPEDLAAIGAALAPLAGQLG